MQPRNNEEVIRVSDLLRGIDEPQRSVLLRMAVRRRYVQGDKIFVQDQDCPGIFIVDVGLVRVVRVGTRGQEHVLHLCGPGQSFAEVAAFGDFPLPANAIASQPTECVLIPKDALQRELATNHDLCRQMLVSMSFWVRHFVQLLDDVVLRDAVERVARLLSDVPCDSAGRLTLPGPKKDLANHLNLTSETFSRVLRRLSEQGVLELDSDHSIRVVNSSQLTRFNQQAL